MLLLALASSWEVGEHQGQEQFSSSMLYVFPWCKFMLDLVWLPELNVTTVSEGVILDLSICISTKVWKVFHVTLQKSFWFYFLQKDSCLWLSSFIIWCESLHIWTSHKCGWGNRDEFTKNHTTVLWWNADVYAAHALQEGAVWCLEC